MKNFFGTAALVALCQLLMACGGGTSSSVAPSDRINPPSSSSSSSSSSGTDSSSDSSSESESEAPSTTARSSTATSGLCRARVRVCREPLAAEWICYACPSGALMCAECVKVHAVWEKTRDHVPVALLR